METALAAESSCRRHLSPSGITVRALYGQMQTCSWRVYLTSAVSMIAAVVAEAHLRWLDRVQLAQG